MGGYGGREVVSDGWITATKDNIQACELIVRLQHEQRRMSQSLHGISY